MGSDTYRELDVTGGTVQCLPEKREPVGVLPALHPLS